MNISKDKMVVSKKSDKNVEKSEPESEMNFGKIVKAVAEDPAPMILKSGKKLWKNLGTPLGKFVSKNLSPKNIMQSVLSENDVSKRMIGSSPGTKSPGQVVFECVPVSSNPGNNDVKSASMKMSDGHKVGTFNIFL